MATGVKGRRIGTKDTVCTQWIYEVRELHWRLAPITSVISALYTRHVIQEGKKKNNTLLPICLCHQLCANPRLFVEKHLHSAEEVEENGCRRKADGVSSDTPVPCFLIITVIVAIFLCAMGCANQTREHLHTCLTI